MKKSFQFTIILALFVSATLDINGQSSVLNGTWSLDRTKSTALSEWPLLVNIKINIKGDTLSTERTYESGDGQQYPFNEKVVLNNKESQITIYDMPRKMKAQWAEGRKNLLFESATTFYGNSGPVDFVSKETWKTGPDNNSFTISFVNSVGGTEASGTLYYNRK